MGLAVLSFLFLPWLDRSPVKSMRYRGWISRTEAVARTLVTLRFFWNGPQSKQPDAIGYNGFYYHFLDLHTGARVWDSELSMIDTALLIIGALTAAQYFRADTADEIELCALADALYRRGQAKVGALPAQFA